MADGMGEDMLLLMTCWLWLHTVLDLKKIKNTKAQSNLNESERAKNIKDCFVWSGENLKDKIIILLDDVVTTGATLNEARKILRKAGARKVIAFTVAH